MITDGICPNCGPVQDVYYKAADSDNILCDCGHPIVRVYGSIGGGGISGDKPFTAEGGAVILDTPEKVRAYERQVESQGFAVLSVNDTLHRNHIDKLKNSISEDVRKRHGFSGGVDAWRAHLKTQQRRR